MLLSALSNTNPAQEVRSMIFAVLKDFKVFLFGGNEGGNSAEDRGGAERAFLHCDESNAIGRFH